MGLTMALRWVHLLAWAAIAVTTIAAQLGMSTLLALLTRHPLPSPLAPTPLHPSPPPPKTGEPTSPPLHPLLSPPLPTPPAISDFQPESVRRSALKSSSGPELRCGKPIPPESTLTTTTDSSTRVTLFARAKYTNSPSMDEHFWSVEVQLHNIGSVPVRPLTVHWMVTMHDGQTTEVQGPAHRGSLPVVHAGASWSMTESIRLVGTAVGSFQGSFQLERNAKAVDDDPDFEPGGSAPPMVTQRASSREGRLHVCAH